ncbi:MAG: M48 family metallopeptidase [Planctomycetes bacterium]|nr:M48 family metallopeptidase [Planctomycetota bacterium]
MRALLLPVLLLAACTTVPVTGRKQLSLYSEAEEASLGLQAYREILSDAQIVASGPDVEMVRRVGSRIAAVADDPGFQWEFNLVKDDAMVNAFCLPGGKVAVYTGILPLTQTEEGLATVMGHEIAHAIARHGGERMSQQSTAGALGAVLEASLANKSEGTRSWALAAFGVGANYGILLPYSRTHESEADEIGLIYMARAGYDPRPSVDFWRRMAAKGGAKPPEFLSTHPSDETRIAQLRALLPRAIEEYEKSRAGR